MPHPLNQAFSSEFFMPRGHSYLWEPSLLWMQVSSSGLIGISHVMIASILAVLVWRGRELPFKAMCLAFGALSVACGLTHFSDVWLIWKPDYWLDAALRIAAASASIGTALSLVAQLAKARAFARSAIAAQSHGLLLEAAVQDLGSLSEKTRRLTLGPVARLKAHPELGDEQRRDLDLVCSNAQSLIDHVDDLLEMARLEARKLQGSKAAL